MRRQLIAVAVIATFVAMALYAPVAKAAEPYSGGVYLYEDGAATRAASTCWRFTVELPIYEGLDASPGYWNMTAYVDNLNTTHLITGTWVLTLYIYDGFVNKSATSGSISVSTVHRVWANLSMPAATYSDLSVNSTASLYFKLTKNASVVDHYRTTVDVEAMGTTGLVNSLIPAVVTVLVIMLVVGFVSGIMVQAQKGMRRKEPRKSKKDCRK